MRKYFKLKLYFNKEVQSYIYGFLFSTLLTIIPFFIAKNQFFSNSINRLIILFCAFVQIIVHFIYFLHLNSSQKNYWYLISLLFILIIIFIVVFGSIWIMFNLNHHLMMI
ncbi:cytochrome o ubiquinol oxidase subunit IV [Buchnera aphidicola (Aphis craccivora)]|uniref:Cytochrome bo(3) ubiquinol oxidase subunit 4 n=1 Tax=Buchnera aphidicola (Aphis craccivora) TaxID=466616 RepID=A0A4D6XJW4_9GAMM|nr:cytochrome o ubiquinol oxidase subunit IV [Buchnera aphidicola]QCI16693.1 cytochrome o ubiquinol oxidase subunit IV [Buchnera aphidicola (Aphis craccivora)]QLL40826.1 cytochrome o ubiquinol oxidase subunit IV [Buchnera aphidicola (Aphis craccivore)]WAI17668.1 MAG: cytochrome o ubiquinol oxidase subunit IV [Buchnera aphidicola (Aphis craccivora)]